MRAAASHAFPPLLPFCRVLAHARIRCPVRRRHAALTYAELEEVPDDARAFEQCGKMFLLRPVPELKESLAEAVESGNKDATALVEKTKHVEETYKKLQEDFNEFLKAHSALLPQPCRAAHCTQSRAFARRHAPALRPAVAARNTVRISTTRVCHMRAGSYHRREGGEVGQRACAKRSCRSHLWLVV